jgi:hypothetical protein
VLKQAWNDGKISQEEADLLAVLRAALGLSEQDHESVQQEIQIEIYLQAILDGWKDGAITPQDSERLDQLREQFHISAEEHLRLEKQVRREILRQKS